MLIFKYIHQRMRENASQKKKHCDNKLYKILLLLIIAALFGLSAIKYGTEQSVKIKLEQYANVVTDK